MSATVPIRTEASRWQWSSILGSARKSIYWLNEDGSSVGQHFRYAVHHFVGIVAHSKNRIGAHLRPVLQHQLESLQPGLLAKLREHADVAANQSLQSATNRSKTKFASFDFCNER